MGRAPCCEKSEVKRGPWSPEEDAVLTDYIQRSGTGGSWISLPKKAGLKRCGKSCRLRWVNYLRPGIKHGCYSEEEDGLIVRLYADIGSRWSVIASHLPGRTDNDVKNYWNTKLKKKLIAAGGAAFLTPAAAVAEVPVYTTTSMDFPVHHLGSMDAFPQAYPEVGPDHWFYQLSNDQFALPRLSEALENGTPAFDALFSASSSTTSSMAKSYASWSDNVEEMESKSSVYFDAVDYYAGSLPSFFDN